MFNIPWTVPEFIWKKDGQLSENKMMKGRYRLYFDVPDWIAGGAASLLSLWENKLIDVEDSQIFIEKVSDDNGMVVFHIQAFSPPWVAVAAIIAGLIGVGTVLAIVLTKVVYLVNAIYPLAFGGIILWLFSPAFRKIFTRGP